MYDRREDDRLDGPSLADIVVVVVRDQVVTLCVITYAWMVLWSWANISVRPHRTDTIRRSFKQDICFD